MSGSCSNKELAYIDNNVGGMNDIAPDLFVSIHSVATTLTQLTH